MRKKILIMAGGTGGHVFPGLAVAKYLSDRDWDVLWLGTKERMEARLVPQHGFEIAFIDIQGVRRNGLLRKLLAPFKIIRAVAQARRIVRDFKPDVVLGMGGYASGPGGVAAWLSHVPLVLHEQNAAAGLTNRILANFATVVCLGFPNNLAYKKSNVVGNPIRDEIAAISQFPIEAIEDRKIRILVVGGSLGAMVFNETLPAIFARYENIEVKHQTGRGNREKTQKLYEELKCTDRVEVLEFIDDMADAYTWADIVICRAGALTVAEIAAAHKMAIFVPLPSAVDDHQTKNAQSLVQADAAVLVAQKDFNEQNLCSILDKYIADPALITEMSRNARDGAILDATEKVANYCQKLAEK